MPDARDIHGTVFKNGSATLLARVVGPTGAIITQSNIASASYSIFLLSDDDPDCETPVTGHIAVAIPVSAVLFDTLQTDDLWTKDADGYNFKHVLDAAAHATFSIAGRRYRIIYRLAPAVGQPILLRFRVHAI